MVHLSWPALVLQYTEIGKQNTLHPSYGGLPKRWPNSC